MSRSVEGRIPSDGLPERLPCMLKRETLRRTDFGGYGSPVGGGGEICVGENLSPRKAPSLASRPPRGLVTYGRGEGEPHGLTWFDGYLIFARGTGLYSLSEGGQLHTLGAVQDTDKSFVTFGGRLYIYPDKLCMERGDAMPVPLELDTGVVEGVTFNGNRVTLPRGYAWSDWGFSVGDCLRVLNADDVTPAPEGYYRILELHAQVATLANSISATYVSNARFLRVLPALRQCCACGDRVYGIAGKDIYVSGVGSATDFYSRPVGDGKHPLRLRRECGGEFTAVSPWQGYVVFFKSDRIYRLLGNRSDSLTLQESTGVGIPRGFEHTLCEVGNDLYYASHGGVYRYCGQAPQRLASFGEVTVTGGRGGSDGTVYFLSLITKEGAQNSLLMPRTGVWYPEDRLRLGGILSHSGFFYLQDEEGTLWKTSYEGRETGCAYDEWAVKGGGVTRVTFAPDHYREPEGYRPVGLAIRATGGEGGTLRCFLRYDEEEQEVLLGELPGGGRDHLYRLPLLPRLCDSSTLRLELWGDWVIHALMCTYEKAGQ